jgi:hypothetical protein
MPWTTCTRSKKLIQWRQKSNERVVCGANHFEPIEVETSWKVGLTMVEKIYEYIAEIKPLTTELAHSVRVFITVTSRAHQPAPIDSTRRQH